MQIYAVKEIIRVSDIKQPLVGTIIQEIQAVGAQSVHSEGLQSCGQGARGPQHTSRKDAPCGNGILAEGMSAESMLEDTCGPEPMSPSSGRKLFASASSHKGSESSSASSRETCGPAEVEGGLRQWQKRVCTDIGTKESEVHARLA